MIRTQQPLPGGQGLLEQRDRLVRPAPCLVGLGQVAPRAQSDGMIRTQQPLPGGQGLLEQRDRLRHPGRRLVSGSQVIPRAQSVRMIRTQQPLPGGQGLLEQRDRLVRLGPPPGRRQPGYSASPGCQDGQVPAAARSPQTAVRRPQQPVAHCRPVHLGDTAPRDAATA